MLLLQTNNVERRFGPDVLFHNINMQINEHGRVALVGRNGAGKTTLLKIIANITKPDEGTVSRSHNATIGYLAQDQGLDSQKSVWAELDTVFTPLHEMEKNIHTLENKLGAADSEKPEYQEIIKKYDQLQTQYKEKGGFDYESKMRGVLHGFGFDESMYDLPVNSLSGGQKTKLALAKILLQEPKLLILDEPTNHLDMNVLSWLEDYLKSYSGALLVVSHDRYFLDRVANEVYDLENKTLTHYKGNYSKFVDEKALRLKTAMRQYNQQQKKIAKLEDFVNKNLVRASTTKRAQARRKQLEKMDKMERPTVDDHSIHFQFHSDKSSGNEVLDVEGLKVGYNNQVLAGPLDFAERKGQRIGIIGPNGIGKSTLLKTILKRIPPISGTIKLGVNLEIGYYDQEQQQLHPDKTVLDEVWDDHPEVDETAIRSLLGSFLFVGDDVFKTVKELSGGQRARLELTKLSFKPINFLILDEPTNHLDIDSREVLETAINEFDGTVLFISHDRYFLNQVATDILDMSSTEIKHYSGNYDDYVAKTAKVITPTAGDKTSANEHKNTIAHRSYQESKQVQRERRKIQREVDKYEQLMDDLQTKHDEVEKKMSDPEIATDIAQLSDLQKDLDNYQKQINDAEEQWTTAAEKLEEFDQQNPQE